jgi:carboxyl-terminal processing protease
MISKRRAITLCVAFALLAALAGAAATAYYVYTGPVGRIYGIVNLLDENFYKPVDREKVLEGAAGGVVLMLGDPYSIFMNPKEWEEFNIRTSGEYSGIGVTIGVKGSRVQIAPPMKGGPADEAGLQGGDIILMVDGDTIHTSDEAAARIRGEAGTDVTLTIQRGEEVFDVTITRRQIVVPATNYSMQDGDIGYIELLSFNEHSAAETAHALSDLKTQGAKAIILDLRYNGGGYVEQCRQIAELFVPEGVLVTLRYKNKPDEVYRTTGEGLGMPLFVLVNEGSASASEILAGAIQDREAGILIGEKTFGKGLVQGAFALKDGSVIKLTTAEYLTPAGRAIDGQGLEPNIPVTGDEEQLAKALEMARAAIDQAK